MKTRIYDDAEDFRIFADDYAETDSAVKAVEMLTDDEILDLVNKHLDENQYMELISEARQAALSEIESS